MAFRREHPHNYPQNEKIIRDELYNEISQRTGYTKKDIAAVIKAFNLILVDKFTEGKTLFYCKPFYKMVVRKYADRTYNYLGKTKFVPAHRKLVIIPGSALYDATGYETRTTKAWRANQKKGLKK